MAGLGASRAGRLAGRVAVVTGGTSGLGRAIALAFAREGAAVTIGDLREHPADGALPTADAIRAGGGHATYVATDVTCRADVESLVGRAVTEFGALHVMVNNAGIQSTLSPAVDKTEAEWLEVIGVDLTGVWFGCQAALRQLIRQGQGGRIINISSRLAVQGGGPGRADYCAAKGGVSSLTRQLAVEAGPHGIGVNAICPGFIVTDATRALAAAGKLEEVRRRTPYHRLGTPEDVAACAVFLASPESEFITGQNLVVDGGASIAG
ncbi:MAG: SDR family oxidoreductase [Candidatus Rokubacteria bacterium]|nr:SDR family oxidoreductase [Candidatus Rokubacteria bacterium]